MSSGGEPQADAPGKLFNEISEIEMGCVLVASADEVDHFFRRGVALVLDHGPRGSRGLLLEMATAFKIGEMAPSLQGTVLGENPLFRGGSAGNDNVVMLHAFPSLDKSVPVGRTGICIGGIKAALEKVEAGELDPSKFKFIFNQCEWPEGQLERELSQGLWRAGLAIPDLVTRQVSSQSERETLFAGKSIDNDRSLWDILTKEMGPKALEAREIQYSRGRTVSPKIVETRKLMLKMMIERIFDFRNQRDANAIAALLDGGATVLGKKGTEKIIAELESTWQDPFWSVTLDKESVSVDDEGCVKYKFSESGAETAGGKATPVVRSGVALLSSSGLIQSIEEP